MLVTLRVVQAVWRTAGGVIDAPAGRKTPGNHTVLAVGVVMDDATSDEYVIIKNSWGEYWGQGGYGFATPRYLDAYGLRAHALEG